MTYEVLTNEQMRDADRRTIESGVAGTDLMLRAGQGVFACVRDHFAKAQGQHGHGHRHRHWPVIVLCGPGNNGGDGFIAAELLRKEGVEVRVACLVQRQDLHGDAAWAAQRWPDEIAAFDENLAMAAETVIVDAVFGTGLDRVLEEPVISLFKQIKALGCDVVAVDIPSGVNGDTGQADPHTLAAAHTVTFHRKKAGHVLYPGAGLCGEIHIHDIGITAFESCAVENHPGLWRRGLPGVQSDAHKYRRGHALLMGGVEMTGAIRLAAQAAMRAGAGLCTIAAPPGTEEIYRLGPAHIIVEDMAEMAAFPAHFEDARRSAALIGPGAGIKDPEGLKQAVFGVLELKKPVVLDADALNVFEGNGDALFKKLHDQCVLTPHEGEFSRLFGAREGDKIDITQKAAEQAGCVVVHKGADTVIAAPGRAPVVNTHCDSCLATAGSGDVLAGMITGFLAQGMNGFDAACAAVWIHGEAGLRFGTGLVASDLPESIPEILKDVLQ